MKNNFLVALVKNRSDLNIFLTEYRYRIRIRRSTPIIVKDGSVDHIALYQPKATFKNEGAIIRYWAEIEKVTIVNRLDIFPDTHPQATNYNFKYYLIHVKNIRELKNPVVSLRPRRVLFIPTTLKKWTRILGLKTPEINDLYNDSPLENEIYSALKTLDIYPERQFYLSIKKKNYFLDFALICQEGNVNIECDGLKYHYLNIEQAKYDNARNNDLTSHGWSVLRYHSENIRGGLNECVLEISKTVNGLGGIQDIIYPGSFKKLDKNDGQGLLF